MTALVIARQRFDLPAGTDWDVGVWHDDENGWDWESFGVGSTEDEAWTAAKRMGAATTSDTPARQLGLPFPSPA